MASTAFQTAILRVMPPWLRRTNGAKLLWVIGVAVDSLADQTAAGVRTRFPGFVSDALPLIGRDRRIVRGPGESDANYAGRLLRWWDDHARRGGPYALLEQLFRFFGANIVQSDLVYHSGTRYVLDTLGTITRDVIAWGADGTALWAQAWLFYRLDAHPGVLTEEEIAAYKAIPDAWNAGHVLRIENVLVWPGVELWGYPSGTWGDPVDAVWPELDPIFVNNLVYSTDVEFGGSPMTIGGAEVSITASE